MFLNIPGLELTTNEWGNDKRDGEQLEKRHEDPTRKPNHSNNFFAGCRRPDSESDTDAEHDGSDCEHEQQVSTAPNPIPYLHNTENYINVTTQVLKVYNVHQVKSEKH